MAWIESHDTLARHPKTRRAARALGIGVPQMIGHLHLLWWWTLEYADDGDLSAYSADDLADAALWEGDVDSFTAALCSAGFLDEGYQVHDWQEYAGRLVEQRRANAEKQRAWREKHKSSPPRNRDIPPTDPSSDMSHNDNVTVTSPSRRGTTVPNRTVPNQTIPENTVTPLPPTAPTTGPAPQAARPVPKATVGGSAYQAMFTAIATRWGVSSLPWTFGQESKAVKRLLDSEPRASPADIPPFLDYLRQTWPYVTETTRLPKPSDKHAADHWPAWWQQGCPADPPEGTPRNGHEDHPVPRRRPSGWDEYVDPPPADAVGPVPGGRSTPPGGTAQQGRALTVVHSRLG